MEHTNTYILCMKLIKAGKKEIVENTVDVYFAAKRITGEEYKEIIERLGR